MAGLAVAVTEAPRRKPAARPKVEIRSTHRLEVPLAEDTTLGAYRDTMAALKAVPEHARVVREGGCLVVTY